MEGNRQMTDKEVIKIIKTLKAYYPYYYRDITPEEAKTVVEVWQIQFKNYDYELINKAVHAWGGKNTTPPSLAELKYSLFDFYTEISDEYTRLLNEDLNSKELERVKKWREQTWACAYVGKKK